MPVIIENDSAYFLHQIPYRDNSAIVHLLTQQHGKVSFVVTGLKSKKNTKRAFLQPCRLLLIDYQLKNQLSQLIQIDFDIQTKANSATIIGNNHSASVINTPDISQFMLYQYANELLLMVLPDQLPTPTLFADYTVFLGLLSQSKPHAALRLIELSVLILSTGLPDISQIQDSTTGIEQDQTYYFYSEQGLFNSPQKSPNGVQLEGSEVQAFEHVVKAYIHGLFNQVDETIAQGAKPLAAYLIKQILGHKKLKTREVYRDLQAYI